MCSRGRRSCIVHTPDKARLIERLPEGNRRAEQSPDSIVRNPNHLGWRFDAAQRSRFSTREKTDLSNKTSSSVNRQNSLLVSRSINQLKTPLQNDEELD